jgi:hypothetical protein
MLNTSKQLGIRIYPELLEDLFNQQINTLSKRISVIEDQIRLNCAFLDKNSNQDNNIKADKSAEQFISSSTQSKGSVVASQFSFITNEDGEVININNLPSIADPESQIALQANSRKIILTPSDRSSLITKYINSKDYRSSFGQDFTSIQSSNRIDYLINRINMNSGQRYSVDDYSLSNKILEKEIDILKITKELLEKVEERQKIIKIFYNSIKNSVEFKKLENADTSNALLVNSVYGNQNMPEILEHMIEDGKIVSIQQYVKNKYNYNETFYYLY